MGIDARIIGAGVAGSAAAARLASWGRTVECVHRDRSGTRHPEETVIRTARPLLESFDLLETFEERWSGVPRHAVIWGSDVLRRRAQGLEITDYKVVRQDLDDTLRARAAATGAHLTAAASEASAALTIVAAGKSRLLNPATRIVDSLPSTVALWTAVDPPPRWAGTTVIEGVRDGWWWWLPLADGRVSMALLCDADEVRDRGRDAVWGSARKHAIGPAGITDARPTAAVVATPRRRECADANLPGDAMLVGDAASTVDPLSSQGIEKALSSADEGCMVANTALAHPELLDELLAHQRAWERALFEAHAIQALTWYQGETRFQDAPFWARRAAALEERETVDPGLLPPNFRVAPDLESAKVWKRGDAILHPADGFRLPGGLALDRVGDVPLAPLLPLLDDAPTLKQVIDRARRLPDFFLLSAGRIDGALTELHRRGFVVPA